MAEPSMSRQDLYPPIEPYWTGMVDVGDGHSLYVEQCGNPAGLPVLVLHGGPGAGCVPVQRQFFDPQLYRIILFDQRGAGRSTPLGGLDNNTTKDLVADIERLRRELAVAQWLVFGGSWGSTLALAYAVKFADVVTALILRGVWLGRSDDISWGLYGLRRFFPQEWQRFADHVPPAERNDLLEAYWQRVNDPDAAVRAAAAVEWNRWEASCETLLPAELDQTSVSDRDLAFARIEMHYCRNRYFLEAEELLDSASSISRLPVTIVHGRYDMLAPVDAAFELAGRLANVELHVISDAGHSVLEPGIRAQLIATTEKVDWL